MGRDDIGQSVGMYSNRLRKTPPESRFVALHRGAMTDQAADMFPTSTPAIRAQRVDTALKTQRRKKENLRDGALRGSLLDHALPVAVPEAPSGEVSTDERERLLQQHATRKAPITESKVADSPKITPSGARHEYDTLKVKSSPREQKQVQDKTAQQNVGGLSKLQTIPSKTSKKSTRIKYLSVLSSDGPDSTRRFVLARFGRKEGFQPLNATSSEQGGEGCAARATSHSEFQHYIPGETFEEFVERRNRHFGTTLDPKYLKRSHKRSNHKMNPAGAETKQGSTTPPDTPPNSVKKPDLKGSRRRFQAHATSVSSTGSAAETDLQGDKHKSKGDIEQELTANMAEVNLNSDPLDKTPSTSAYSVLKKRKAEAVEQYRMCKKALKKLEADTIDNNGNPDRSLRETLKKAKLQAKRCKKLTQDHLDHLNQNASHDFNGKDLEDLLAKTRLERLQFESLFTDPPSASRQIPKPSLFLTILPPELRRLIYLQLLTTTKPIHGGDLLEDARTTIIIPATVPPTLRLSISAAILRACRTIYTEALPILYQENCFAFSKVSQLLSFRIKGLPLSDSPQDSPYYKSKHMLRYLDSISTHDFAFKPEPQGRLGWLRSVHLRFTTFGRAASLRGMRSPANEETDWLGGISDPWTDFLNEERYADVAGYVRFPALRNLVLDFSDWELKPSEGLRVRAFEVRFRGDEGPRELTTVGLSHEGSVEAFRGRLLGKGGVMRVLGRGALGGVV